MLLSRNIVVQPYSPFPHIQIVIYTHISICILTDEDTCK